MPTRSRSNVTGDEHNLIAIRRELSQKHPVRERETNEIPSKFLWLQRRTSFIEFTNGQDNFLPKTYYLGLIVCKTALPQKAGQASVFFSDFRSCRNRNRRGTIVQRTTRPFRFSRVRLRPPLLRSLHNKHMIRERESERDDLPDTIFCTKCWTE